MLDIIAEILISKWWGFHCLDTPKDPKGEGTRFSVVSFSCVMAIQEKEEDSDEDETEESEESEESVKDKKKTRP